jgi:DNA-binding MarR family transcriptional regulator
MRDLSFRLLSLASQHGGTATQARALAAIWNLPAVSPLDRNGRHFTASRSKAYLCARASLSRALRQLEREGQVTRGRDRSGAWYAVAVTAAQGGR